MPTRSNSVELFVKKISDYMSADYIYVDASSSILETIKDLQQQKKSFDDVLAIGRVSILGISYVRFFKRELLFFKYGIPFKKLIFPL